MGKTTPLSRSWVCCRDRRISTDGSTSQAGSPPLGIAYVLQGRGILPALTAHDTRVGPE
jgi:hypothetical protein